jgi:hypothetical protein
LAAAVDPLAQAAQACPERSRRAVRQEVLLLLIIIRLSRQQTVLE